VAEEPHLHRAVEGVRLLGGAGRGERPVLVVVRLRHLHEPHALVVEVAEHAVEEVRERDVVGIEHEDEVLAVIASARLILPALAPGRPAA
jgi:hypothetical protein